jgi:hypothetical protein
VNKSDLTNSAISKSLFCVILHRWTRCDLAY